jgi:acetylornithine deacetylase/succinyl-diaminopimelate desuccinylase-like protein
MTAATHATNVGFIDDRWEKALPVLMEYIAIPARSPMFDPDWETTGHLTRAAHLLRDWAASQAMHGMSIELIEKPGLSPFLYIDIDATDSALSDHTVVIYGHMDKQPEMEPWSPGLAPWSPVLRGERLYGRGSADDGYAIFAALIAVAAVHEAGGRHGRLVLLIEASEESSSVHLDAHLETLLPRIGDIDLVITLDSFCETYDRLWTTTSTRGVVGGVLDIEVCLDDPHSGRASGVLPSSFRIARALLDRIEDSATGELLVRSANVEIPKHRVVEADVAAAAFPPLSTGFRPLTGVQSMAADATGELLNGTWRPALEVIGVDGLPPVADAGNVFRSRLSMKLSLRIPPTADPVLVGREMKDLLEKDPPHGARIQFTDGARGQGWSAPAFAPWLTDAIERASERYFGRGSASCGVGGSIPFMGMLGAKAPGAQFLLIGVLGPESNAHGPDEFLHLPTVRRVTATVADVLMAHAAAQN